MLLLIQSNTDALGHQAKASVFGDLGTRCVHTGHNLMGKKKFHFHV